MSIWTRALPMSLSLLMYSVTGRISYENLNRLLENVGKKKLVLDLSCRKKDGSYYIVTDRWQKYTKVIRMRMCLTCLPPSVMNS